MRSSCGGRFASTKGSGAIRKRSGNGGVRSSGATQTCSLTGVVSNLRPDDGSWMNREVHVQFWEGVGLRCPALLNSTFLRLEALSNNLRDFGLNKGLDNLDDVRRMLGAVTDRFAAFEAQALNVHVDFPEVVSKQFGKH